MTWLRKWFRIRKLSRMQELHWVEASYINHLYDLLQIITTFSNGLKQIARRK